MSFPTPTEKQAGLIWNSLTLLAVAAGIAVIGGAVYAIAALLSYLSPILLPIAMAGIIACLLDPAVMFFEKMKIPRVRSILLVYVIAGGLLMAMLSTVLPVVYVQATNLIREARGMYVEATEGRPGTTTNRVAGATNTLATTTNQLLVVEGEGTNTVVMPAGKPAATNNSWYAKLLRQTQAWRNDPRLKDQIAGIENGAKRMMAAAGNWLLDQFGAVSRMLGWAMSLILIPVYIFYFLAGKAAIQANWKDYLPIHHESEFRSDFIFIVNSINDAMIVFFRGQILVSMITGAILAVGLSLQGVKYALLIGFVSGMLGIVPYLGFMLSAMLAVGVAAIQFGDMLHPGITLGICIVVQWIEGFGYQPQIIGDRVGLHPMTIIVALFLGTTLLGGLIGGILAIPLAALVNTLMKRYVWVKYRHEVKTLEEDAEEAPPS